MHAREPAVFIRKSTDGQDEKGQKDNVRNMLRTHGVTVPGANWFEVTVSRRHVMTDPDFKRLLDLVEGDRISTVYVESQDRWGTGDRPELFTLLGMFRRHETELYDLRAGKNLADPDLATELLTFINSVKSEKELQDISFRSLRSRINNFQRDGSWPTGAQPFGYAKACFGADGALRWEWHPSSRTRGQLFTVVAGGGVQAGEAGVRIRRKERTDRIQLIPHQNKQYTDAVRLVFDLYTRAGLSRRQIAIRLNASGFRFYDRPFNHSYVTQILTNPAYVGETHFGKTQCGELHTFDKDGLVVAVKKNCTAKHRTAAERITRQDTHKPLVDRRTWDAAVAKLAAEAERVSYAPRNAAYYLKPILVCGHCGANMSGRTEVDPTSKKRVVVYMCQTYLGARARGTNATCGAHRITHAAAEALLMERLTDQRLQHDATASLGARATIEARLEQLGLEKEKWKQKWDALVKGGVDSLCEHFRQQGLLSEDDYCRLRKLATRHYWGAELGQRALAKLPIKIRDFMDAVRKVESAAVKQAAAKVAELEAEHLRYTNAYVNATAMMQGVIRQQIDRLEQEIAAWKPRTVAVSEQLKRLYAAEDAMYEEHDRLMAEWPALEAREKGEALRRVFKTVTLYWDKKFRPALADDPRPRKTTRPGRYSYTLDKDRIEWAMVPASLAASW